MDKFKTEHSDMKLESETVGDKKIFTITFPFSMMAQIEWPKDDLDELKRLDSSQTISDQLQLLAMVASRIERIAHQQINTEKESE